MRPKLFIWPFRCIKLLVIIGLFGLSSLAGGSLVCLAQETSLSLIPPLLEITAKPGKSLTYAFDLFNPGQTVLYLTAKIVPFSPADHFGHPKLFFNQRPPSQAWFSLANANLSLEQTFALPAGSKQQLLLKISLPKDAKEGDYYFTFLITHSPQGRFLTQSGTNHQIGVGANILLTISKSGNPKKQGVVARFLPHPKIADLGQKVTFEILIQNTGEAFFKPEGKLLVKRRWDKKIVASKQLQPDNILLNSARFIFCQNNNQTQACQFSSWLPGIYQAILQFSPDGSDETTTISKSFIILPIRLLGGACALLAIILLVFKTKKGSFLRTLPLRPW